MEGLIFQRHNRKQGSLRGEFQSRQPGGQPLDSRGTCPGGEAKLSLHSACKHESDAAYNFPRNDGMNYIKGTISVLGALFLAICIPGPWSPFRGLSSEKAIGLAALAGSLLSPWLWIVAFIAFALFLTASHLRSKFLRVLLFWLPAGTASLLMVMSVAFITYVLLQIRHS